VPSGHTTRIAAIAVLALLAGGAAGWIARGKLDRVEAESAGGRVAEREAPESAAAPAALGAAHTHDDELRQILIDPNARALAARVRNASTVNGECEVEVDTTVGWFRAGCGAGDTPSVGEKFELFGRLSPEGQIDGAPPLLRPSWLEPVGTIARLRGQ
jgi:hypothetical protein